MGSEITEGRLSSVGDLVWVLTDEEVFALWDAIVSGYLILPHGWSDSLIRLYGVERAAQGLPTVIVSPASSPWRFVIVGNEDSEGFHRRLQFAVGKGAFVRDLRPDHCVFSVLTERGRAEDLARELAGLTQRGQ